MALTREQLDTIDNIFNDRRLTNKIEMDRRKQEVFGRIPEMEELNQKSSSLAINAARKALGGDFSLKNSLKSDLEKLSKQRRALLLANGFNADYLDEIYTCPKCHDTGKIGDSPCECMKSEIIKLLYSRSELKELLDRENFDTFRFDFYSDDFIDENKRISAAENIESVVDYCHYFIEHFDSSFDNLLFYGKAGTGKTFLINCIAKELMDNSHSVIYLSSIGLFDLMADYSFRRNNNSIYSQITMEELRNCDLLIIDDLGTEMTNSFTDSSLFDCLNERLIHQKSTIISTNLSLKELQNKYDDRIFSRTTGNYTFLKIFGDDIRNKKKISN